MLLDPYSCFIHPILLCTQCKITLIIYFSIFSVTAYLGLHGKTAFYSIIIIYVDERIRSGELLLAVLYRESPDLCDCLLTTDWCWWDTKMLESIPWEHLCSLCQWTSKTWKWFAASASLKFVTTNQSQSWSIAKILQNG